MIYANAKKNFIIFLFATCFSLSCSGFQIKKDAITDPGQMLFNGHVKENVQCFSCHNGDATGTWRGENLKEAAGKETEEKLIEAINNGPGMFMPSFKDILTEEQKQQIVKWLKANASK